MLASIGGRIHGNGNARLIQEPRHPPVRMRTPPSGRLGTATSIGLARSADGEPNQMRNISFGSRNGPRTSGRPDAQQPMRGGTNSYRGFFRVRMIAALSSPPYTKIAAIE
jgi:hypothetical protein